jgi:hypothetical protein
MSFLDRMTKKFGVKERTVASRAKSVEEQITETIENQISIANGKVVKGTNGAELNSWRSDKGDVSIKIGVLPLFIDSSNKAIVFQGVGKKEYMDTLVDLKKSYENGELAAEVENLKVRKAESDKKASDTRKEKKAVVKEDRSSLG